MRDLEQQVGRVFRRMRWQRFITMLVWSWTVSLLVVALVLAGERVLNRSLPGPEWAPFAVAGGLGTMAAALLALLGGASRLDAAMAIDRAFRLQERLSTALTLPPELRETPAGRALVSDAIRRTAELDVASAFGLRMPKRAWVVLVSGGLAVGMLFVPPWVPRSAEAQAAARVEPEAMVKQAQALSKKISSQRQAIDKERFPDADQLLAKIEKRAEELAKAPPSQKDKLLVEFNKLTDALKERKKQLGSPEQVSRQLQQLKEMGQQGPADKLAKDLARGDFKKAAEQLKQLQEQLKKGEMNQAEKQALRDQLGEMAQKLNDVAKMEERRKQLEEAFKNGGLSQQQYEREMEKLQEQSRNLQQLQQIANQLSQAQEALRRGDEKQAADALGMSQQQLSEMASQLDELAALDSALADVMDAKNGMSSDGMNQLGQSPNAMGLGESQQRGDSNGLGRGRGAGDRPEADDDTALYTTKVNQQVGKGKAVLQGTAEPGKTVKGRSVLDVQGELEAAAGAEADALSNQKIPKTLERHIRAYYEQLNQGR